MDLQDFEGQEMYFDLPMSEQVKTLLDEAAEMYSTGGAEAKLIRAFLDAPENLTVLVAMYRFYYYQHRWNDALYIADQAMLVSGKLLDMTSPWQTLTTDDIGSAALRSMGLLRVIKLLKSSSNREDAVKRLQKVVDLDPQDRLGGKALLNLAIYGSVDEPPNIRLAYVNEKMMAS